MSKLGVALGLGGILLIGVLLYLYEAGAPHQQAKTQLRKQVSALQKQVAKPTPPPPKPPDHPPPTAPDPTPVEPVKGTLSAPEDDLTGIKSMSASEVDPHLERLKKKQLWLRKEYDDRKRVLDLTESKLRSKEVELPGLPLDRQNAAQEAIQALQRQQQDSQAALDKRKPALKELAITIAKLQTRENVLAAEGQERKKGERIEQEKARQEGQSQTATERDLQRRLKMCEQELKTFKSRETRLTGDVAGDEAAMRIQQSRISEILGARVGERREYSSEASRQRAVRSARERLKSIIVSKNRSQAELSGVQEQVKEREKSIADIQAELALEK